MRAQLAMNRMDVMVKRSARGAEALRRAAERTGKSRQQLINEWALTLTEEDMR